MHLENTQNIKKHQVSSHNVVNNIDDKLNVMLGESNHVKLTSTAILGKGSL